MKQNIFGVILFSVIVGTAIFISECFVGLPSPPSITEKPVVFESRSRCGKVAYRMPAASPSAKIRATQVVLNQNNSQLNTSLLIERENSSVENMGVSYHFFVKNGSQTRYLASETVNIKPNFGTDNKAVHEIMSSYAWLDDLDSKDNLYLIVESSSNGFRPSSSIPRFDEINASAVLLMKGKK